MMQTVEICSHIEELASSLRFVPASPAFPERYHVARALVDGRAIAMRTVAAPVYVTDLGVRSARDATQFYLAHCRIAGIPALEDDVLGACVREAPLCSLRNVLDGVTLFFGECPVVSSELSYRCDELLGSRDYNLLVYAGCLLAAERPRLAVSFFEAAAKRADDVSAWYGAQHRAAACEIKRLDDLEGGLQRLKSCRRRLDDCGVRVQLDLALNDNLAGLALLRSGHGARDVIVAALARLDSALSEGGSALDSEDVSRAARYRSQIAINLAQLEVSEGKYRDAVSVVRDNVDAVRLRCRDYLPEALGELAYVEYCAELYESSIRHGIGAFHGFREVGSVSGMRSARQVLAAALMKNGETGYAEEMVRWVDEDPLGIECERTMGERH